MKTTYKTIVAVVTSIFCTYVGVNLLNYLRVDYCLDRGGRVTSWGACQYGDGRAEMPSLSIGELLLVLVFCALLFVVINFIIRLIADRVLKT